jgi:menaquinone-9 beta-reductase
LIEADAIVLTALLAACDEVELATIRSQWPFLARLVLAEAGWIRPRLRPAVLFFAGLLAAGKPPDAGLAAVAAGIELAQMGTLAIIGPSPSPSPRPAARGVDWATATTVLAGDFLLAQASRLVAEHAPEVSWSFADWLAEVTALRFARLGQAQRAAAPAAEVFGSLFEFPARVGALLGGCSPAVVSAFRDAGYHSGRAFLHAEDVLALRAERTRTDASLRAMLRSRISAIPEYLGDDRVTAGRLAADHGLRSTALGLAARHCLAEGHAADLALAEGYDAIACRILRAFTRAVTAPALAARDRPASHSGWRADLSAR